MPTARGDAADDGPGSHPVTFGHEGLDRLIRRCPRRMVVLDADRGRAGHIADERHATGSDRSHLGPRGCREVDASMAGGETVIRASKACSTCSQPVVRGGIQPEAGEPSARKVAVRSASSGVVTPERCPGVPREARSTLRAGNGEAVPSVRGRTPAPLD